MRSIWRRYYLNSRNSLEQNASLNEIELFEETYCLGWWYFWKRQNNLEKYECLSEIELIRLFFLNLTQKLYRQPLECFVKFRLLKGLSIFFDSVVPMNQYSIFCYCCIMFLFIFKFKFNCYALTFICYLFVIILMYNW